MKLICFTASWCKDCMLMKPIFEELNKVVGVPLEFLEFSNQYQFDYNLKEIPTMILFRNGKEIVRKEGLSDLQGLVNLVKNN